MEEPAEPRPVHRLASAASSRRAVDPGDRLARGRIDAEQERTHPPLLAPVQQRVKSVPQLARRAARGDLLAHRLSRVEGGLSGLGHSASVSPGAAPVTRREESMLGAWSRAYRIETSPDGQTSSRFQGRAAS